jgi:hypothetical protein
MRIRRSTQIGGVLTRPGGKKHGVSSASGCGTCGWRWGTRSNRLRCARPSLLPPSPRSMSRLLPVRLHLLPPLGMAHPPAPPASENGALHRSRLSAPAGWHASVSSREVTSGPGAASGRGRKFARGLCSQYSPLPFLPSARTVSMEWQRYSEAAPGQRALASAPGWFCPTALARLEPQSPPARLHAARAPATPRGQPLATGHREATHHGRHPLPRAARALASVVGSTAGSQCPSSNRRASHDQVVRRPGCLCRLARFSDNVTRP